MAQPRTPIPSSDKTTPKESNRVRDALAFALPLRWECAGPSVITVPRTSAAVRAPPRLPDSSTCTVHRFVGAEPFQSEASDKPPPAASHPHRAYRAVATHMGRSNLIVPNPLYELALRISTDQHVPKHGMHQMTE